MFTLAFAQTGPVAQPSAQSPLPSFILIFAMIGIFYFLVLRPQKKSQDDHQKMLNELKKNDEVITSGGIYGTIVNIQDDIVFLRVDDNTRIKVQKISIAKLKK